MTLTNLGGTIPVGEWQVDGWRIKTTQGRKVDRDPGDRQVWVASPGGQYQLLSLAGLGAITRLWYFNEELLYPSVSGFRGGEMVMDYLRDAVDYGLTDAAKRNGLRSPRVERGAS